MTFHIEKRAGRQILVYHDGSCRPAHETEIEMAAEIAHLRDYAGRTHELATQVSVVVAQREAKEEEIEAMREKLHSLEFRLKEASSHLSGFLGFHSDSLTPPQMRSISECLAKLQPSL